LAAPGDACRLGADSARYPGQDREPPPLFDHLVGCDQKVLRDDDVQRLGGLQIDGEFEPVRLLDRQVAGFLALDDAAA
jgi:hypothetical protein